MNQNREIEAKTILNEETFKKISISFPSKNKFVQKNYYFDTANADLKKRHISFRIRVFDDHAEQTLKVPDLNPVQHNFHEVIEINDPLTIDRAKEIIRANQEQKEIKFYGNVGEYLQKHFSTLISQLKIFTWSETNRLLARGPRDCELTLDETRYPDDYIDYELEIENTDPKLIHTVLKQLESKFNFKQTRNNKNQNKIARASLHRKKF